MKILFYMLVAAHYALLLVLAASIPMLLVYSPWYVSIPLVVWIINLFTLPVRCVLTTLENRLRAKIGLPRITGFFKHWVLWERK